MKKALLLLVFLSGAVVAFFLSLGDGDVPLDAPLDGELARFDEADPDSLAEDLTGSGANASVDEDGNPVSAREAVAGAPGAAVESFVIQVWAGRKGVPAPGAEVYFAEVNQGRGRWPRRTKATEHWSEVAIQRGQRFVSDADGRVKVPGIQQSAMVTARRPGEYGFRSLRRKHKPVEEVTLAMDETLRVRVVDARGRGIAGVPVGVHQVVPERPRSGRQILVDQLREMMRRAPKGGGGGQNVAIRFSVEGGTLQFEGGTLQFRSRPREQNAKTPAPQAVTTKLDLRARQVTDANGEAAVQHFQLFRRGAEKWWGPQHVDRFQVAPLVPLSQPVVAPFAGRPVPTEVIQLTMPPTGSVVVRVVDHEGRPFAHPANAELHVQGDGATTWTRVPGRKEQDAEAIVFPFVGLGLQLMPRVWLDDRDFTWSAAVAAGPGRAGERVAIDVPVPSTFGILRGRLIDAAGKPLTGIRPTFLINGRGGRLEGEDLELDPMGRFQLTFQVGKRHQPPFSLEVREPKVHPPRGLVVRLPALRDGHTLDLGDLTLDAFDSYAHGVVKDDRGQPIVGASVRLQRERMVGAKNPKPAWRDVAYVTTRTDEQGRFELFANPLPGRFRVSVTARRHFAFLSAEVTRGAELDVTMTRTASLVATLRLPKWMPKRGVRLRVFSPADPKFKREEGIRSWRGKNAVFVRSVRPGVYAVQLHVRSFADPILRIDGVRIDAGQEGEHPLLTDLDLASLLYRYEITAVDQQSLASVRPNGPLLAEVVRLDGKREFVGFPWTGNKVEVFSANPQMQIVQLHTGYRVRRSVVSHGASQLSFEKLPPVRLSLPGARRLVGPDLRVRVSMVLTSETGLPAGFRAVDQRSGKRRSYSRAQLSKSNGAWLGATDVVSIPLMAEGEYEVIMRLRGKGVPSVPVVLGKVKIAFPSGAPPAASVPVDVAKVRAGLDTVAEHVRARDQKKAAQAAKAAKAARDRKGK